MDKMKKYRQLIKELPSRKIVFAFGRFQPPTAGHLLLINITKKLAAENKADYVIFVSSTQDLSKNPLSLDKKMKYLKLLFPGTNFIGVDKSGNQLINTLKSLDAKYKNVIMVAGSDRIPEYDRILTKYNGKDFNFDSVEVISAGERDPDSDTTNGISSTKMRDFAAKGNFDDFKLGLPGKIRDIDNRRLMNDLRSGMGLSVINEKIIFSVDELREKYFRREIYNIGDVVESSNEKYEIVDRGSNYLSVVDSSGNILRKWLKDVSPSEESEMHEDIQTGYSPKEISFKGYTTKNLHHSADAAKAFKLTIDRVGKKDPVSVLNALKATDTYMKLNDLHLARAEPLDKNELADWVSAHNKAKSSLEKTGEYLHHLDYWNTHRNELQNIESMYNIQTAGADMTDSYKAIGKMIPEQVKSDIKVNKNSNYNLAKDVLTYKDFTKLLAMNKPKVNIAEPPDQNTSMSTQVTGSNEHLPVGSSLIDPDDDHQVRRRKVKYALGD